ncbi:MAG TPA: DUF6580 family putative transport protein [Dehalococcoidia bacterium]|nr:DUF6580 family putative transport protein [Dehalococcoidia bacterium]
MSKRQTIVAFGLLIVVGVVARLVPHIPNFAPVTATALFCGVYMNRRLSLVAPALVMALSDYMILYINPYGHTSFSHFYAPWLLWHSALPFVYLSFGVSALVGWYTKSHRSGGVVVAAALLCSLQFFLITNAAVWIDGMYSRGIDGLYQSYVAALPFFRGTALGDLFYTCVFFGLAEFVLGALHSGREAPATVAVT